MRYRDESGIGLLELMLSLAVIAILLVMATRFFGVTQRAQVLNHAAKDVAYVLASLRHWQGDRSDFQDVSLAALSAQGLLPDDIHAGGALPPWGGCESGTMAVRAEGEHHGHVQIVLKAIDAQLCQGLAGRYREHDGMIDRSVCVASASPCQSRFELQVH